MFVKMKWIRVKNIMQLISIREEDFKYYIHKLNNLLTIIRGNAELIKLKSDFEETEDILLSSQKSLEFLQKIIECHKINREN